MIDLVLFVDDHSRVCLETPPSMVESDYINASFIYKKQKDKKVKAYIAAQGMLVLLLHEFTTMSMIVY